MQQDIHPRIRVAAILLTVIATSVPVVAVAAGIQPSGLVVEGESVPDVKLGAFRADVVAAIGAPGSCRSITRDDRLTVCTWTDGRSMLEVHFMALNGAPSTDTPDDVVELIRFSGFPGWKTIAGLTTTVAETQPTTVTDYYPAATVTRERDGALRLTDTTLGIEVVWYDVPTMQPRRATIAVFPPGSTPEERILQVDAIKLATTQSAVTGDVAVTDTTGRSIAGAKVTIRWETPLRVVLSTASITDRFGVASFEIETNVAGIYTLVVTGIELDGARWDQSRGPSSASVRFDPERDPLQVPTDFR